MTDTITNSNSINVAAKAAVDAVKQNNAGQASAIKPALTEAVSKAIDSTVELSGTLKAELAIAEYDAKKVAEQYDFPHKIFDYQDKFFNGVISSFVDSYANGETPVPCIQCNQTVKFSGYFEMIIQFKKE